MRRALSSTARRVVSISCCLVGVVAVWVTLPLTLAVLLAVDFLLDRRLPRVRGLLFVAFLLACETWGVLVAALLWMGSKLRLGDRARYLDWNFALQQSWAKSLFWGGRTIFGFDFSSEGEEVLGNLDRPILLLVRHSSVVDTVFPAVCVSAPTGLRLRYVLKSPLLWDPCLDIVGHRLPNAFVRRGVDSEREIARVRALAGGLSAGEGVLIYPEGTRVTSAKKARIHRSLERRGDQQLLRYARSLRHTLPPLLGGTLALLEECPDADVLVLNHVGLEGAVRLSSLWNGRLIGSRVRVSLRRIDADQVPREREAAAAWLYRTWREVDDWLNSKGAPVILVGDEDDAGLDLQSTSTPISSAHSSQS